MNTESELQNRDFHDEIITIDGQSPLLIETKDEKYIDWYKQGRNTAIAVSVSFGPMSAMSSISDKMQTLDQMSFMHKLFHKRDDIILVRIVDDLHRAKQEGKLGIILDFQNATAVEFNLDLVHLYKAAGVGVIQLTYNTKNQFGDGVLERTNSGLSNLGVGLIKELNDAKIIVDVSHTGEKTCLDAVEFSRHPVIISHANSRNKYNVPRNVPDNVIKAIAKSGGFVGAVMYPDFIRKAPRPTLDDYIDHIKYIADLVGPEHVAVASDYFGGQSGVVSDEDAQKIYERNVSIGVWDKQSYPPPPWVFPEGLETPKTSFNLTEGLLRRGFSKDDIRKIWGGNWIRVMKEVWR